MSTSNQSVSREGSTPASDDSKKRLGPTVQRKAVVVNLRKQREYNGCLVTVICRSKRGRWIVRLDQQDLEIDIKTENLIFTSSHEVPEKVEEPEVDETIWGLTFNTPTKPKGRSQDRSLRGRPSSVPAPGRRDNQPLPEIANGRGGRSWFLGMTEYLDKRGGGWPSSGWRSRYVVMSHSGDLEYYLDRRAWRNGEPPRGRIPIAARPGCLAANLETTIRAGPWDDGRRTILITAHGSGGPGGGPAVGRTYVFGAPTDKIQSIWIEGLTDVAQAWRRLDPDGRAAEAEAEAAAAEAAAAAQAESEGAGANRRRRAGRGRRGSLRVRIGGPQAADPTASASRGRSLTRYSDAGQSGIPSAGTGKTNLNRTTGHQEEDKSIMSYLSRGRSSAGHVGSGTNKDSEASQAVTPRVPTPSLPHPRPTDRTRQGSPVRVSSRSSRPSESAGGAAKSAAALPSESIHGPARHPHAPSVPVAAPPGWAGPDSDPDWLGPGRGAESGGLEGVLEKPHSNGWSATRTWKSRYFVLTAAGELLYYRTLPCGAAAGAARAPSGGESAMSERPDGRLAVAAGPGQPVDRPSEETVVRAGPREEGRATIEITVRRAGPDCGRTMVLGTPSLAAHARWLAALRAAAHAGRPGTAFQVHV